MEQLRLSLYSLRLLTRYVGIETRVKDYVDRNVGQDETGYCAEEDFKEMCKNAERTSSDWEVEDLLVENSVDEEVLATTEGCKGDHGSGWGTKQRGWG